MSNNTDDFKLYTSISHDGCRYGRRDGRVDPEGIRTGALIRIANAAEQLLKVQRTLLMLKLPEDGSAWEWANYNTGLEDSRVAQHFVASFIARQETARGARMPHRCWKVASWIRERYRWNQPLRLPHPDTVYKKASKAKTEYRRWRNLPSEKSE